ncbi:MAG: DUF169 domain-containing protein [Candidatus Latescibacteria bacterium]|nr:DUF169 domain-containing protein [Candidatus Latescibacterota bacterium]
MNNLSNLSDNFQHILKLKLFPVGVKFCQNEDDLKLGIMPKEKLSFCQTVHLVSQSRWTLSCPPDQMACPIAGLNFGFRKKDQSDIDLYLQKLTHKKEIAESVINIKPKFQYNEIKGIITGPLEKFTPDVIFLIIDSAQALVLMRAYGFATGKYLTFRTGASSNVCAYGGIISYLTQMPNLTIPCAGGKRHGLFQDSDLIFVMPLANAQTIAQAMLEMEQKNYLNFPIIQGYLSPTRPVDYLIK